MADPVHTKGTKLYIGDGASPEVFTHVKKALAIPTLLQEKPEIDVTTLDSLAREYIAGLGVGSNLEFEIIWDAADAGQIAVKTAYEADRRANWRVDFPDGTRASFAGALLAFGPGAAIDDAIKGAFTVKISGDITFTDYTP